MSGPDITPAAETSIAAVDAQPAATAPVATAGSGDVLATSNSQRNIVIWGATITVCACLAGIVGSLCYLVIRDGNSALVADVTGKLTLVAIGGMVAMTAALFGQNNVLGKLIDKLP